MIRFILGPFGIVLAALVAFAIGDVRGRYVADLQCTARINASVGQARAEDQDALRSANADHQAELAAEVAREKAAKQRILDYAHTLKSKGSCSLDDADVGFFTGGLR